MLIGDWNRNGFTDNGEQTIFYTTAEALKVMDSSQQPNKSDVRYTLARSLTASWLNYLAGNPVDTAATNDFDARVLINRGITWLQTYTPDENTTKDGKGDGMLSNLSSTISSSAMSASHTPRGPRRTPVAAPSTQASTTTTMAVVFSPTAASTAAIDRADCQAPQTTLTSA